MPVNDPTVKVSNINNKVEITVEYNDGHGYMEFMFELNLDEATKLAEDLIQEVENLN